MKLHIICANDDLRPAMNHVQLKNGFFYATDAHKAVKLSLQAIPELAAIFTDEDEIYFEAAQWKNIFSKEFLAIEKTGNMLTVTRKKGEKAFAEFLTAVQFEDRGMRYPDIECVISYEYDQITEGINQISIDAKYLQQLQEALGLERCVLRFGGETKQIQIFDAAMELKGFGILMPCMLSNDFKIEYPKKPKQKERDVKKIEPYVYQN